MTVPVSGVVVHRDLVHTALDGYRPLALDLYLPPSPARALAVYLHGGGWRRGSRRQGPGPLDPTSDRLFVHAAERGLAVASIDYRLSGEARFPAQLDDLCAACAFLEASAGQWGLDGTPLTLWGVSAGGTLAALRGLDPACSPPVRAVAVWYAVTDVLAMPGADSDSSREALLLGAAPASVPGLARRASPVAQVHAAAPPFLVLHGDADDLVPPDQGHRLAQALTSVEVSATWEAVPGWGHMFGGMPAAEVDRLVDRTVDFLLDPPLPGQASLSRWPTD